jgi:hypothetical protein
VDGAEHEHALQFAVAPAVMLPSEAPHLLHTVLSVFHAHLRLYREQVKRLVAAVSRRCKEMQTVVDDSHHHMLERLWGGLVGPQDQYPGPKHARWKAVGFQVC